MNALPKILPINELKNTAKISKTCHESDGPIVITKNGYGDMVLMSMDVYEKAMFNAYKMYVVESLNEALDDIENGDKGISEKEFFAQFGMSFDEE